MAEIQPAHYTQNACHTAQGDRLLMRSLICEEGVTPGYANEFEVTTAGSGLDVEVNSGSAWLFADSPGQNGVYFVASTTARTFTMAAADPTDDRHDLIILRVYDSTVSGVLNEWHIEVVTGTPSPAPADPAIPANSMRIARVLVTAGQVGPIPAGDITDLREFYQMCSDSVNPDGLRQINTYNAGATFQKADFPWLRGVRVRLVGGGGGGGGCPTTGAGVATCGGGGGGGGYAEEFIEADDLGASVTITIGAGGVGAANTAGTNGGTTSFGAFLSATGGDGGGLGNAAVLSGVVGAGGDGGTGAGSTLVIAGQKGGQGRVIEAVPAVLGEGGASHLGFGARPVQSSSGAGIAAAANTGGGGSAGMNAESQVTTRAGGNGGSGRVIVELYG